MKRPPLRGLLLYGALALVLAASAWTHLRRQQGESADPADAVALPRRAASPAAAASPPPPSAAAEDQADAAVLDLFAAVNWDAPPPAPPPPPPVAPAAPPQAPALPFEYLGRTEAVGEAGGQLVHLRRGSEMFSVRAGDSIDAQYRLEQVSDEALQISYLPLAARQTLIITGSR